MPFSRGVSARVASGWLVHRTFPKSEAALATRQEDDRPPLQVDWASPTQGGGDERASERLGPSQDSAIDVFCASICAVS